MPPTKTARRTALGRSTLYRESKRGIMPALSVRLGTDSAMTPCGFIDCRSTYAICGSRPGTGTGKDPGPIIPPFGLCRRRLLHFTSHAFNRLNQIIAGVSVGQIQLGRNGAAFLAKLPHPDADDSGMGQFRSVWLSRKQGGRTDTLYI